MGAGIMAATGDGALLYERYRQGVISFILGRAGANSGQREVPLPWGELDHVTRDVWRDCERFILHRLRQAWEPSAPLAESETAVERYERHVAAVQVVLMARRMHLGQSVESLRDAAEELLAAADAGI